jgi:hypothetical protein
MLEAAGDSAASPSDVGALALTMLGFEEPAEARMLGANVAAAAQRQLPGFSDPVLRHAGGFRSNAERSCANSPVRTRFPLLSSQPS